MTSHTHRISLLKPASCSSLAHGLKIILIFALLFCLPLLTPINTKAESISCSSFPNGQSQDAKVLTASCGEGAERRVRLPFPLADAIQNRWSEIQNSGNPNAAEEMQKVRQIDLSVNGTIEFPVARKWSYTVNQSGANAEKCGTEDFKTKCSRPIYKDFPATCQKTVQQPYQGSCTKYVDEPYTATCSRDERQPYQDTCYKDGTESYSDTCRRTESEDYSATCSKNETETYTDQCTKNETEEYSATCSRSEKEDYSSTCTRTEDQEYSATCSKSETETYSGTCSRDKYETETERVCVSYSSSSSSGAGESEGEVEDSFRGSSSSAKTCSRYEDRSKKVYKGQESYSCDKTRTVDKEYSCTKSKRVEKEYACTKTRYTEKDYACTKTRTVPKSYSCSKTRTVEKSYSCTKSRDVEKSYSCQKTRPTRTPYSCTQYKTVAVPYSCTKYQSVPHNYACTLTRPVQKDYACTESRTVGNEDYSCTKQRTKTCTWKEIQEASGNCQASVPYSVAYTKDPYWKPGYKDIKETFRDYQDILPNKFDLLPGESEELFVYANTGQSDSLNPALLLKSNWNEYRVVSAHAGGSECRDLSKTKLNYTIETVGRKKVRAPNPLSEPVDQNGNVVSAITFESLSNSKGEKLNGRPISLNLKDVSRATILAAASVSRTFERPVNAAPASGSAIYKSSFFSKLDPSQTAGNTVNAKFWVDNRFRIQLYYKSPKDKWVRISQPIKLNSDQADILGDSVVISLTGEQGLMDLYKASGPLERLFGGLYKLIGFSPTPGREYVIKVQSVVRGLPFYLSGCRKDYDICEKQEPLENSYSEPLLLHFTADKKVDKRSWFQKVRDFQERHTWITR